MKGFETLVFALLLQGARAPSLGACPCPSPSPGKQGLGQILAPNPPQRLAGLEFTSEGQPSWPAGVALNYSKTDFSSLET